MRSVQFGQNHCYVIQGGDLVKRYLKRVELMGNHPGAGMIMAPEADRTLLQLYTDPTDVTYDTLAEVVAKAKEQGNFIDLDA